MGIVEQLSRCRHSRLGQVACVYKVSLSPSGRSIVSHSFFSLSIPFVGTYPLHHINTNTIAHSITTPFSFSTLLKHTTVWASAGIPTPPTMAPANTNFLVNRGRGSPPLPPPPPPPPHDCTARHRHQFGYPVVCYSTSILHFLTAVGFRSLQLPPLAPHFLSHYRPPSYRRRKRLATLSGATGHSPISSGEISFEECSVIIFVF